MGFSPVILFLLYLSIFSIQGVEGATDTTYSADFILTYPQMQNAGVSGTMVYDLSQRSIAFLFTALGSKEIYKFNINLGYGEGSGQYEQQYTWKVVPNSACSPCGQYSNTRGFPFTNNSFDGGWASSVLVPPAIKGRYGSNVPQAGTDSRGCTRYNCPEGSWASYFGIKGNELCYLADTNGRLFTITEGTVRSTYDSSVIEPPTGCKCLLPVDIAVSLDRSSSITTESTYYYNAFMKSFAQSFYFNSSDPSNTAQLSITQWGGRFWPLSSIGNLNFTSNPDNIQTAVTVMGCTTRSGSDCKFCYNCNNDKKRFVDEYDEWEEQGQGDCSNPKKPSSNGTRCTYLESTCTGCGIRGMADQFTRSTYNNRPTATKLAIVVTDGRSNTPSPGNPTYVQGDCVVDSDQVRGRRQNIGCYRDITESRQYLLSKVPSAVTYAIGVGTEYSTTTLDRISGSPDRSFNVSTFSDLLANIQKFVLGFCALPNPVTECGSGCCGFCQCGVCVAPDTPLTTGYCSAYNYTLSTGNCYITPVPKTPCPPRNCHSVSCNNGTDSCSYVDQCQQGQPGINECFDYACVRNATSGFYSCQPSLYLCAPNTTRPPTSQPTSPTEGPPTGPPTPCEQGCGEFGECDSEQVDCVCKSNYTGVLCGVPPDVDVCQVDGDCFINHCIVSVCVEGEGGGNVCLSHPRDCGSSNLCQETSCDDSVGCMSTEKQCDDGLLCTDDSCDPATGECLYQEPNCSHMEDECHTSYCSELSLNLSDRCQAQLVDCERESNCSISECREGEGCVSQEYSCAVTYYGVAAIAGGIVAGIVIVAAFVVLCAAATAGGGYAVSRSFGAESESHVHVSPLYQPQVKTNTGLNG